VEGERLMSFTNTADPLFMFGAVAVGMFGYPQIGVTIAIAHYLSSITTGILLRFYGRSQENTPENPSAGFIATRALRELYHARNKDGRPMGQLMGDAIRNSVNTLLLIGGFIILFSVIIRILTAIGVVSVLSSGILFILSPIGLDPSLTPAIISGFFEVTLGCQLAAQAPASVDILQKVMVASAVIAWSGLSVHAQVASIISGTGMKIGPFVSARFVHGILASVYTYILMGPLAPVINRYDIPVFLHLQPGPDKSYFWVRTLQFGSRFIAICAGLMVLGLLIGICRRVKIAVFRG
jgi:sporulation integral membrane protein YlbJ